MSNTPNRRRSAGKPRKKEIALDLTTARQMLPLVQSIVSDIVGSRMAISRLTPEQERLERHRRDLVWLERERRYQLSDEISAAEKALTNAVGELSGLGVNLVDDEAGEVDFPTKINGRAPPSPGSSATLGWPTGITREKTNAGRFPPTGNRARLCRPFAFAVAAMASHSPWAVSSDSL